MNTDQASPTAAGSNKDAFDLMLAILQRWKWLLGVGIVCAVLAYGIGLKAPQWYVSTAVIDPMPPHPVDGLDYGTLEARRLFSLKVPEWLNSPEARAAAAQRAEELQARLSSDGLRVRTGKQDGLVTLTVEASQAEAARSIAEAVLAAAFEASRPAAEDRDQLQLELDRFDEQLVALGGALTALRKRLAHSNDARTPENASYLVSISSTLRLTDRQRQAMQSRMEGLTQEYVKQAPSLPWRPNNMRPPARAAWAFVGGLLAVVTLIGMRWTFAGAGPSPAQWARFQALFFRRGFAKS